MSRAQRQHGQLGSPQAHGRTPPKLTLSRREGAILSFIFMLGVAICVITFYRTGDPSLPHAAGAITHPGAARADDPRIATPVQDKFRHRGKAFIDASTTQYDVQSETELTVVTETGARHHSTVAKEVLNSVEEAATGQEVVDADEAQGGNDEEDDGDEDNEEDNVQDDDQDEPDVVTVRDRNPYGHARPVQSPDGKPLQMHTMPDLALQTARLRNTSQSSQAGRQQEQPSPVMHSERLERDPASQGRNVTALQQPNSMQQGQYPAAQVLDSPPQRSSEEQVSAQPTPKPNVTEQDQREQQQPQPETTNTSLTRDQAVYAHKISMSAKLKALNERLMPKEDPQIRLVRNAEELHAHQNFITDVLANGLPSERPPPDGPAMSLHPIVRVNNLTTAEFEFRYATEFGLQPVVITNSQNDWFSPEKFTMESLRELIGSKPVRRQHAMCKKGRNIYDSKSCHSIKESDPDLVGKRWASLKSTNLTALGVETYDEFLSKQIELAKEGHYIYAHEISGSWLPEIEAIIRQPKYFLNNIHDIDQTPGVDIQDRIQGTHFPSIFFGASGSSSPLHSDARMTRFWIMQLTGKKLLRLVPPADNWRGDASDSSEFQPTLYTVDLMHPNYEKHPHMHSMLVYETVLEPGDILFIPEGWAHQALNLEWTWMISSNYVDEHNIPNLLNFILYEVGKNRFYKSAELDLDQFFLPINNPLKNLTNTPLEQYFERLTLEYAPASDAAKHHCNLLAFMGIPPEEWRDHHSRRVMAVALENNYLQLAKWLHKQGVPLENDETGRTWLKRIIKNRQERLEMWMRQVMEVDEDDNLSDIPDEDEEAASR